MNLGGYPILRRDPGQVGLSLGLTDKQILDGWKQLKATRPLKLQRKPSRIVVTGMGGSHLAADIVRSVLSDQLPGSIDVVADYRLPAWVKAGTLVISSSYSGGTEETLAAWNQARQRRLPTIAITSGGKLAQHARRQKLPLVQFNPTANPSNQPRLGLGYGLAAILTVLWKVGWIAKPESLIELLGLSAKQAIRRYEPSHRKNPAWDLAVTWNGRIPILIGSEWMAGNLQTFTNQVHENAKTYAAWYLVPDMNHHLLEGLRNRSVTKNFRPLILDDRQLHPRNRIRLKITGQLCQQLGAKVIRRELPGTRRWSKAMDLLVFGGYVSWYLAAQRRVSPAPIPTVNALKQALAKV